MNNFELRITIWKLINPLPAICDRRPAGRREKVFQRAVSGKSICQPSPTSFHSSFKLYPAIYLFDELIAFLPR
jgi:hypothetical protein